MTIKMKPYLIGILLLGVAGAITCLELLRLHHAFHTDPLFESWCTLSSTIDCAAFELSDHAAIGYLPRAVLVLASYLGLVIFAIVGLSSRSQISAIGLITILCCAMIAASMHAAYVALAVIGAISIPHSLTFLLNIGILILILTSIKYSNLKIGSAIVLSLKNLRKRYIRTAIAVVVLVLSLAATALLYPKYWMFTFPRPYGPGQLEYGTTDEGHTWIGSSASENTIVEYSDYECPYCARSHAAVRDFVADEGHSAKLIHRHFPLDMACNKSLDRPFHQSACNAARAALCASDQKNYWMLNDLLYASRSHLDPARIVNFARLSNIEMQSWIACYQSNEKNSQIQADIEAGAQAGGTGTPFYIINGKYYRGKMDKARLERIISPVPQ